LGGILATPARIIDKRAEELLANNRESSAATLANVPSLMAPMPSKGTADLQVELLLREIEAKEARRRGPDKMDLLDGVEQCSLESCAQGARITLGGEPFCLNHFILRCYKRLDQLDPRIRAGRRENAELNDLRESVEECSNRALLLSLRCESLTNLDRSRLLDILLWSSDLLFLLSISARDFDLLRAFRQDSELATPCEPSLSRPRKIQTQAKGAQDS
jgi:hypothetical protein